MTTDRLPPPGLVAFCAPGSEHLAAAACNLHGMRIAQVIGDPDLSGDDLIVMNPATLGLLRQPRRYWLQVAMARIQEDEDRAKWIDRVKRRLGLVAVGDASAASVAPVEWPAGLPDGQWETISVHTLELPGDWPPGCRCVLSDGERVSLGGPCPAEHP